MKCTAILLAVSVSCLAAGYCQTDKAVSESEYLNLTQSYFVANSNQSKSGKRLIDNPAVIASLQTPSGRILFSDDGAYVAIPQGEAGVSICGMPLAPTEPHEKSRGLPDGDRKHFVVKMGFDKAHAKNRQVRPRLEAPTGAKVNFFIGPKEDWQSGLPTFNKLVYPKVWDGIDVVYSASKNQFQCELIIEPGGEAQDIVLDTGVDKLKMAKDGQLEVSVQGVSYLFQAASAYQTIAGKRMEVTVAYKPLGKGTFGFEIGTYDKGEPIVIQPQLVWGTYFGGFGAVGSEGANAIAVDSSGMAYMVGGTAVSDFPLTIGEYDPQVYGGWDIFVSKIDPSSAQLVYSVRIGGMDTDIPKDIAVDDQGNVYVCGGTRSKGFPTTEGAFDESFEVGSRDGFLFKLNPDGSDFVFSTFLGGTYWDEVTDLELTTQNQVVVYGETSSTDFPTTPGAYSENPGENYGLFVAKLSEDGSSLIYSTNLGGRQLELPSGLAVDQEGNAYVVGTTTSDNYPTTPGAFDSSADGYCNIFVSKLNATGTQLAYSTFLNQLGTNWCDYSVGGIAVDGLGQAYITGYTYSSTFPVTEGAYDTENGGSEIFVSKMNSDGSDLIYSTFLKESGRSRDIYVDAQGFAYILGDTGIPEFPTTENALDSTHNGNWDLFVTKINESGTGLVFSTFLGGQQSDNGNGLEVATDGSIFLAGFTYSDDFPTTANALQRKRLGRADPFFAQVNDEGSALLYSTFFGGSGEDEGAGIALDAVGNVVIAGHSRLMGYPTTTGAFDLIPNGESDVVVTKLNPQGNQILFSTYLGGENSEKSTDLAIGVSGDIFLTGSTQSTLFPVTNDAFSKTLSGLSDAFVARLSSDGSSLHYASFLGGMGEDFASSLVLDSSENAYIVGLTYSDDFPLTMGAFGQTHQGEGDGFYAKLDSLGEQLLAGTYLGGSGLDEAEAIALSGDNQVYITGHSASGDFPVTLGAFDSTHGDGKDGFVAKLNPDGSSLEFGTFFGGSGEDLPADIALDSLGNVVITGWTQSIDFPTTPGAFQETHMGGKEVFVSKLGPMLDSVIFSTLIGDAQDEWSRAMTLDSADNIFITGGTTSNGFPITLGALAGGIQGPSQEVFLTQLAADGQRLKYSTLLTSGGFNSNEAEGVDIATDTEGLTYLTGWTDAPHFPTTPGVVFEEARGQKDIFVAKLNPCNRLFVPQRNFPSNGPEYCHGETLVFSVEVVVDEDEPVFYQWMKDGTPIPGANEAEFNLVVEGAVDNGRYHCEVSNSCSTTASASTFYRFLDPLEVTQPPTDMTACEYGSIAFSVGVNQDDVTYQWFHDGEPVIGGGQAPNLMLHELQESDKGSYWCEVVGCETVVTEPVNLNLEYFSFSFGPGSQGLGLKPPSFTYEVECSFGQVIWSWDSDPATPLTIQGETATMYPPPSATTTITIEVSDNVHSANGQAILLVASDPIYFDFNGDGCNNLLDLWDLAQKWNQAVDSDPNGDGKMNVLDFLYINLSDPLLCP